MVKLTKKVSLIFMAVIMCVTYTAYGSGVGSTNIKFGDPDEKKGTCSGKGICMLTSIATSGDGTIGVSFELLPEMDGSRDVVMTFNINDLRVADATQADLFVGSDGRPRSNYNMNYTLTNGELCSQLGVRSGEIVIKDTDSNVIEMLSGSTVRVTYRTSTR
ncbi:MAG: hypothetical protein H6551_03145 [Chitinophagales bacterium]|nr:hypothetical protein [Chitinophagales bacterium]